MINVLAVNDDGIQAAGFAAMVKALSEKARVYICAPDGQRSAKSHSITLEQPLSVRKTEFPGAAAAYVTSGSPADCTKIGLQLFREAGVEIDMVFSGINMGCNLGRDTLYSGTVGAAAEGALNGYHSVAVSVASHDAVHFDAASKLAAAMIERVYGKLDKSVVININTPNLPVEKILGIKYAPLSTERYYDDTYHPAGETLYALSGEPTGAYGGQGDSDMAEAGRGYAVITPLQFDFTAYRELEQIKGWELDL